MGDPPIEGRLHIGRYLLTSRSVPSLASGSLPVVFASGARGLRADATHRSRTFDLTPGGGRQKGRTGHAALLGLVVDGVEQAAVEGDVDPS